MIPDGGGRHNGIEVRHFADKQTMSQPTAGPDLTRPIGRQHHRLRKHGLSKLRRHESERQCTTPPPGICTFALKQTTGMKYGVGCCPVVFVGSFDRDRGLCGKDACGQAAVYLGCEPVND